MARKIKSLDRIEIIYALRRYAHPSWYHDLLSWSTGALYGLLDYYQRG